MRAKRFLFSDALEPAADVNRIPDQEGMAYGMLYGGRTIGTPGGAYLERQSTRQLVLIHRTQISRYLSRYRLGLQAELNYPIARGNRIINTAPDGLGSNTGYGRQGAMRQPPRFRKALRAPITPYDPQTY